jgi:tripartite-type tricarboxylate transporter receptor subunit TctC
MDKLERLTFVLCATFAAAALAPPDADAQGYPAKPVRIYIGYGPGGAADFTARVIAQKLQLPQYLAQPFIVDSRPGAGSTIAIRHVTTQPPDGYSLLVLTEGGLTQSARGAKLPYDIVRDLTPIAPIAVSTNALIVHPLVPAKNVKELVQLARSSPGKLTFGSSGNGSAQHLAGELFNMIAKVKILHVPYKGGAQAAVATAGGEVDMSFASVASAMPFVSNGKVRMLAITMGKRASFLPDVPTLNESGLPGYEHSSWYGVVGPAAMPRDIVAKLNTAIGSIVSSADTRDVVNKGGLEPQVSTPEQFSEFIRAQLAKATKLSKAAGLTAN